MKKITITLLTAIALFTSCSKDDDNASDSPVAVVPTVKDIYIAGNQGGALPKYWKNGVETILSKKKAYGYTNNITVSGNDVYVAGYEYGDPSTSIMSALYWKNGVEVFLTDGKFDAFAQDVVVVGNDVYACGAQRNAKDYYVATYWKNGVAVALTNESNTISRANAIAIVGNDVYVAGYENPINGTSVAKYWKNGIATKISDGTFDAVLKDIKVVGSDVYVCGYEYNAKYAQAKFWKNGVATNLTMGTSSDGIAESILVQNNQVYTLGNDGFNITSWKNNTPTSLSLGTDYATTIASGIFVVGNDVYTAGSKKSSSTAKYIARYWKNNTENILLPDVSPSTEISGLFITTK